MPFGHRQRQQRGEIVDVAGWEVDPDNPHFPEGRQPKLLLIAPRDPLFPFIIPGHRYLFKKPAGWQINQIWSEVIAYELSKVSTPRVPPAFLAVDSATGEPGVLIEFFYGYRDEPEKRLVPGSDYLHSWLSGHYDRKWGRPHQVRQNLTICRSEGIPDYFQWWFEAFAYDALIGNPDRHPDNWGILFEYSNGRRNRAEMAPLFDNGSSLAYEIPEDRLARFDLGRYMSRGRHHCALDAGANRGALFMELCEGLLAYHRAGSLQPGIMLPYTDVVIDGILAWCQGMDYIVALSAERADLLRVLLRARRDQLREIVP